MDIVWVNLNPTRGREQANLRPALVLSPRAYNEKTHLAVLCPITSHVKGYPFEVVIKDEKVEGAILADHVRSVDWKERKVRFIQKLSRNHYEEVEDKIRAVLALDV